MESLNNPVAAGASRFWAICRVANPHHVPAARPEPRLPIYAGLFKAFHTSRHPCVIRTQDSLYAFQVKETTVSEHSSYHLAEHVKSGYEGMLIALPSQYWPSAQDSSLRELARRILPRQVATSKRGPKIDKPKGYVDGATARAHVSTARVLAQARGQRP